MPCVKDGDESQIMFNFSLSAFRLENSDMASCIPVLRTNYVSGKVRIHLQLLAVLPRSFPPLCFSFLPTFPLAKLGEIILFGCGR